jgi:hypothetical protein
MADRPSLEEGINETQALLSGSRSDQDKTRLWSLMRRVAIIILVIWVGLVLTVIVADAFRSRGNYIFVKI